LEDEIRARIQLEQEEERKREALERLPDWFPRWLYDESTAADLREYFHMIYWGGLGPQDIEKIPSRVYHVTPNPESIMREGFKTAAELGVAGFGGTGDYISTTTLENARTYLENMRMACKIINGLASLTEVREWMVKQAGGREEPFDKAFDLAKAHYADRHPGEEAEKMGIDYPPFNKPDFMWEVFSDAYVMDGPGFTLFIGKPTLLHKRPEQIRIVEAIPSARLRFRHHYNIFPGTVMSGRYTYNNFEKQWRIWNPADVKPVRILE